MGEGYPVLWVHGLGESSLCFDSFVERFPGVRHLLVDLPGYGRAPRTEETYSLEEAAELLAETLAEHGPAVVVGHSMGGVIGTFLAEKHPELLTCLINVDGNISIGDCGYSGPISAQPLAQFLESGYRELLQELKLRGAEDLAHRGYARSFEMAEPTLLYRHSQELVALSQQEELAKQLTSLTVPHLYIGGSPNGAAPRSVELLREAKANLALISPSGHWPFIDEPEQFAHTLKEFLLPLNIFEE